MHHFPVKHSLKKKQPAQRSAHSRTRRRFWLTVLVILAISLLLNLIAWNSPAFCDFYIASIFPIFQNTYGRFTSLFPFSLGEYMILAGILTVILALILAPVAFFCRKTKFAGICRGYYRFFAGVLCFVTVIMTLNCSLLYHASELDPNPQKEARGYTLEELEILRNYIVERCLSLSESMERDEAGYIIYEKDIRAEAQNAVRSLSGQYPNLSGFYPVTKYMMFSGLMSQSYMCGYYFPFSLETNVNAYMHVMNYPFSICHELSHFKGYIYEYDANFLAFLACVNSDDPVFQYSGYLNVLNYVNNDYYDAVCLTEPDRYAAQPAITDLIRSDNAFLAPGMWEKVEENAILSTETVNSASDTFLEASLQMNGVTQGVISYSEVVKLLLQYYDGILWDADEIGVSTD